MTLGSPQNEIYNVDSGVRGEWRLDSLLDVNSSRNIMHYETGVGHTDLRFMPLNKSYESGTENQWEKIPRP